MQWNTAFYEEVIAQNGLVIWNDCQSTHYWITEDHKGVSIIDLISINRPMTKCSILADDHPIGSDYKVE